MKNVILISFYIAFMIVQVASQSDKRIDEIRQIYTETNRLIAQSETEAEGGGVFLTELVINKNNASYPAVGVYNSTIKFYYKFGDNTKDPYPNRLMKIVVKANHSAMTDDSEYLFDTFGDLIFVWERSGDETRRMYYESGRLIRFQEGDTIARDLTPELHSAGKNATDKSGKLLIIFKNTL